MRTIFFFLALLAPVPAHAQEVSEELEAAGVQLAISRMCKASLGDSEIFEAVLAEFERQALSEGVISRRDLRDIRNDMSDVSDIDDEKNLFTQGFCAELRAQYGLPPLQD